MDCLLLKSLFFFILFIIEVILEENPAETGTKTRCNYYNTYVFYVIDMENMLRIIYLGVQTSRYL